MMARSEHTPDEFDAMADDLATGAEALRALSKLMRENQMPSALIHGTSTQTRYVPSVLNWIEKTTADVKVQLRSHLAGIQSDVERRLKYHENAKLAAARKPRKKPSS